MKSNLSTPNRHEVKRNLFVEEMVKNINLALADLKAGFAQHGLTDNPHVKVILDCIEPAVQTLVKGEAPSYTDDPNLEGLVGRYVEYQNRQRSGGKAIGEVLGAFVAGQLQILAATDPEKALLIREIFTGNNCIAQRLLLGGHMTLTSGFPLYSPLPERGEPTKSGRFELSLFVTTNGKFTGRDIVNKQEDSLDECEKTVTEMRMQLARMGGHIISADATSPTGEKKNLHKGEHPF